MALLVFIELASNIDTEFAQLNQINTVLCTPVMTSSLCFPIIHIFRNVLLGEFDIHIS